jgi:hypothetical protein
MPAPRNITLVLCLLCSILNTSRFPIAYAQNIMLPPSSLVIQGNPWGVTFQEIISPGFALERVELLAGPIWQVTARMSILQTEAYVAGGHTPVLFVSPHWVEIPSERSLVRPFILSPYVWLPIAATPPIVPGATTWPATSTIDTMDMVIGEFDYERLPGRVSLSNETQASLVNTPNVASSGGTHATIAQVYQLQIQIPHVVFTALQHTADQNSSTRALTVGVAYLHSEDHTYDHLHSGIVRVDEPDNLSGFARSFTAITSQRYSFMQQPTIQIFETVYEDSWTYIGVVTFAIEDGVTLPQIERNESVLAITPSITTSDESSWHTIACPNEIVTPTGCASDIADEAIPFCSIQPIWKDPTKTDIIAYRIKFLVPTHGKQPSVVDNLFIRLLVHAVETSQDLQNQPASTSTHSFMNIQVPFIASVIRCGGVVVREKTPSTDETIQLAIYTGTTLVPLIHNANSAPLLPEATATPLVASTASNFRARSILDSLLTTSLIGEDATFQLPSLKIIVFVDILTVHVRDTHLYETLLALSNGGSAYSVRSVDQHITLSAPFTEACSAQPNNCAVRELIRNQVVLLPAYVHVVSSIGDDVKWTNELFRDDATSPQIAQTFVENVYRVILPNQQYRRAAWVSTPYEWTDTNQAGTQDNTLIFTSFTVV